MAKNTTVKLMTDKSIALALNRIAYEIIEKNQGIDNVVIIGIRTGGAVLADRLKRLLDGISDADVPLGIIDITLYRDDIHDKLDQPVVQETDIIFDISDKVVILVDDVLYTGRTVRAALDALIDFGRPRAIQLAILIDRGHRELPIRADYAGKEISTSKSERVEVHLKEINGKEEVIIDRSGRGGV